MYFFLRQLEYDGSLFIPVILNVSFNNQKKHELHLKVNVSIFPLSREMKFKEILRLVRISACLITVIQKCV